MMTVEAPEVRIAGSARDARQLAWDVSLALDHAGSGLNTAAKARLQAIIHSLEEAAGGA